MNKVNLITIDGPRGIGKTSQALLLGSYLKGEGVLVKNFEMDDTIESALKTMGEIDLFCKENPEYTAICDGSIAEMIEVDIQSGVSLRDVEDKYKQVLHNYAVLFHKYKMLNILLNIDNFNLCQERINKRNKLLEKDKENIDLDYQMSITKGLSLFDNYTFTNNIKFNLISTTEDDSMLDVREKILAEIKKPPFGG